MTNEEKLTAVAAVSSVVILAGSAGYVVFKRIQAKRAKENVGGIDWNGLRSSIRDIVKDELDRKI